jgi:hypothetical protein
MFKASRVFFASCLLFLTLVAPWQAAQAQGEIDPLSQTYLSPNRVLTFQHPESWQLQANEVGEDGVQFALPDGGTLEISLRTDIERGGAIYADFLADSLGPQTEEASRDYYLAGRPSFWREGAGVALDYVIVVMDWGQGTVLVALAGGQLSAVGAEANNLLRALASAQVSGPGIDPVPEIEIEGQRWALYTRPDGYTQFYYPVAWLLQENDSYTFLDTYEGVTYGLSGFPIDTGGLSAEEILRQDLKAFLDDRGSGNFERAEAGRIEAFQVGGRAIARVALRDSGERLDYIRAELGGDTFGTLTILGPDALVDTFDPFTQELLANFTAAGFDSASGSEEQAGPGDLALPLIQKFAESDSDFIFRYPADWDYVHSGNQVFLSSDPALLSSGDPDSMGEGEVLLAILGAVEDLESAAQEAISDPDEVESVLAGFIEGSRLVTGGREIQSTVFAGHPLAYIRTGDDTLEALAISIEIRPGEIITLVAFTQPGSLELYEASIFAIAESLAPSD